MLLFFDTETTGLPRSKHAPAEDLDNWPRLVQIAWILTDLEGRVLQERMAVIRPEGFVIPDEVARFHGISQERALREGLPLRGVIEELVSRLPEVRELVAHNIGFDHPIVHAECLRLGLETCWGELPRRCTMRGSTDFCQLPGRWGRYKWPTLIELHEILFGEGFEGAHDALVDIRATVRCFQALRSRGVL